jgi:hypothetical protein
MCKKHLRSDRGIPLFAILFTLCFQFLSMNSASAQVLGCNSGVQISLDQNCEGLLTPDHILEGAFPGTDADYLIEVSNGESGVGSVLLTEKGTFSVSITFVPTGQSCWGSDFVVEDKLAPTINDVICTNTFSGLVDNTNMLQGDASGACALGFAALPAGVQADITAAGGVTAIGFDVVPFSVNAASDYTFTPGLAGAGCAYLYYVYPAGAFDPMDPCFGFIPGTAGFQSANSPVFTLTGMANLPAGDYELIVCVFPADGTCGYEIAVASSDACPSSCVEYEAFVAGTSSTMVEPELTDNCGTANCTFVDVTTGDFCNLSVTRTWICEDDCGNVSAPYDQVLTFDPVDLADITAPTATVDLSCGVGFTPQDVYDFLIGNGSSAADALAASWPTLNGAPLSDNICNLAVVFADQAIPACGPSCNGNSKVIRTWTIFDWCNAGASIEFTQIIRAQDTEAPTLTFDTDEITVSTSPWGCGSVFTPPSPSILHDNCDDNPTYTVVGPVGSTVNGNEISGLGIGTHVVTYFAEDCCGNVGTATVTVNVVDATPPVAVAVQNIVVSLTNDGNGGQAKIFTNSVDNGSHDGCGPVTLEIRRDSDACDIPGNDTFNDDGDTFDGSSNPASARFDPDNGEHVKFCCEDVYGPNGVDADGDGINDYGIVQVWLRVIDAHGNISDTWSDVRVEDKLAPALVCPADITIDCDVSESDTDVTGVAQAFNACDNAEVGFTDLGDIDNCNTGLIRRRWFVVGTPSVFCIQRITKEAGDPFDGDDIVFPPDVDTDCTDLGFTGIPIFSSGACDLVAFSMESDTFLFDSGACLKILNRFSVIDWCQFDANAVPGDANYGVGVWNHTQTIRVNDSDAPTLTCEDVMLEANDHNDVDGDGNICEAVGIQLSNSASDEGVCASNFLRWEAELDLWSDGIIDQVYSSNLPSTSPYFIAPTSNGQDATITLSDIDGSMANHSVVWKVSDGCGNVTSCTQNFMVTDKQGPTPYCVNLSTALMENGSVDLWAIDFNLGAFDNCSNAEDLRYTFSNVPPTNDPNFIPSLSSSSQTFTCDDLPETGTTLALQVYVWDEKDNSSFCTVNLTLIDNQNVCGQGTVVAAPIAGRIATEDGIEIEDVEVELATDAIVGFPFSQMTNATGDYAFFNNPMFLDYEVASSKNDNYLNGVSTLDLVLIQKHLLGITPLNSSYKIIAADVNGDSNISAIDLIELRKLILGIYLELPSNDSWRFVDAFETWINPANPFPFTEVLDINNLTISMMNEDFIGVKIGDVNNTVVVSLDQGSTNRSSGEFNFAIDNQSFQAGNEVTVEFRGEEALDLIGYQFTLNTDKLVLTDVSAGTLDVTMSNFAVHKNEISSSWNDVNTRDISSDEVLFTMTFKAEANGDLSEALSIGSSIVKSEVYSADGTLTEDLGLQIGGETIVDNYKLYQNEPNPFATETVIGFELPVATDATLSIFDVTGKVISEINGNYSKGYNAVRISKADLNASGIIYYQLQSGSFSTTKKMILID